MINEKYIDHNQALRYAVIEAFLDTEGKVNSTNIVNVFGMHRCNAAKIINKYILDENLDVTYDASEKTYRALPDYKRVVLADGTNAVMYLKILHNIHGKRYEDNKEVA